jgi:hypothetical protein
LDRWIARRSVAPRPDRAAFRRGNHRASIARSLAGDRARLVARARAGVAEVSRGENGREKMASDVASRSSLRTLSIMSLELENPTQRSTLTTFLMNPW